MSDTIGTLRGRIRKAAEWAELPKTLILTEAEANVLLDIAEAAQRWLEAYNGEIEACIRAGNAVRRGGGETENDAYEEAMRRKEETEVDLDDAVSALDCLTEEPEGSHD